jgi:hypothetical protein
MSLTQPAALAQFDSLPNDAIVPDRVAAALLSISVWTLRRENPVPARQITERRRGRRVGDLRNKVNGIKVKGDRARRAVLRAGSGKRN